MRTKSDISSDYIHYLINQGYDEAINLSQDQALGFLTEKMYLIEKLCPYCKTTSSRKLNYCFECKKKFNSNFQLVSPVSAFWHFCEFVIHRDPKSRMRVWNSLIKEFYEIIEFNRLSAVMAPRGHGKSYLAFVLYTIFKSWLWEYFECILACNIPKMGKRNLRILKINIDSNEFLLEKKDIEGVRQRTVSWGNDLISYNYGVIETLGVGSTPKSAHVHWILIDDPLRDDRKYPDSKIENFVLAELLPCIGRMKGRMMLLGTPIHSGDIFHLAMNTKKDYMKGKLITDGRLSSRKFYSKVFDSIIDEKKKITLLPESFSYDELMSLKETQGESKFNREYRCRCTDDKDALFPYVLLRSCTDDGYSWIERAEIAKRDEPEKKYVIGIDAASSDKSTADFFGAVVLEVKTLTEGDQEKGIGLVGEKVKILRHIVHEKGWDDYESQPAIKLLAERFNNAYVLVEQNNAGIHMIQYLERMGVNVEAFKTDRIERITGVRFLKQEMKSGHIWFPGSIGKKEEDDSEHELVTDLKQELMNFGVRKRGTVEVLRALAGHDDLVDALWIANNAAQRINSGRMFVAFSKIHA